MTKQEAIQALKEGHKVSHKWFSNDEYLYMENGESVYLECLDEWCGNSFYLEKED